MAVAGDPENRHGIILAKNELAKKYGIQTAETIWQAKQKCPALVCVPPHHGIYSEISRRVNAIYLDYTDLVDPFGIDESFLDVTNSIHLFGRTPAELADTIRARVRAEIGITISVGVSFCRVFAKLGSDYKKPDATTVIDRSNFRTVAYPLPVSALLFVGKRTNEALRHMGILTIGDLAVADRLRLVQRLGEQGDTLWRYANGMDDSMVISEPAKSKGIGNSTTLTTDAQTALEAKKELLRLAESVGGRLRSSHQLAGLVCTEIKYNTFRSVSHQALLDTPTASTEIIYRKACDLFDELWDGTPVRLLGIRTTKLVEEGTPIQLSLFDYAAASSAKQQKLDAALDQIRTKYGKDSIKRGSLLDSPKNH